MKSIVTIIPLLFVGLAACSTNKPAGEPEEGLEVSEDSSLVGESSSDHDGVDVSRRSSEGPVVEDATPSERARTGDGNTNREIASPAPLAPTPGSNTTVNTSAANTPSGTQPDNTAVNERERSGETKTPLDQGNNQPDLDITQTIRRAVVSNDSLSFTAKNVKIITERGRVTLRGPVNTAQERATIVAMAKQAAGVVSVDDQLEVKP